MNAPFRKNLFSSNNTVSLLWLFLFSSLSVSAADFTVRENAGQFEILLDFLAGKQCEESTGCSLTVVSVDGTAQAGVDYVAVNQRISWVNGDGGPKSLVIEVIDNNASDGSKSFSLSAQDLDSISLPGSTQTVEIVDDETNMLSSSASGIIEPGQVVGAVIGSVCPQIQQSEAADTVALKNDCNKLQAAIDNDDTNANGALAEIAPDQAGALLGEGQQTISTQMRNIAARMGAVRNNRRVAFSDFNIHIGEDTFAVNDLFSGGSAGTEGPSRLSFFVNGELSFGERENTTREEGYDFTTTGITAGLDYRLSQQLVVGAAMGLAISSSEFSSGGKLDSTGLLGTMFATWHRENMYIDGGLSFGTNSYEQDRVIKYSLDEGATNVNQKVASSFSGLESSLFINSGFEFFLPSQLTLIPQVRFEFVNSNVDGFTEKKTSSGNDEGAGWRVRMDSQSREKLLIGLGLKASKVFSTSNRVWAPYAAMEWIQDFRANKSDLTGSFLGDPGSEEFILIVDRPDDNFFRLNLGTTLVLRNGKSAFLDYSTLLAVAHDTVNSLNAGFRWEF